MMMTQFSRSEVQVRDINDRDMTITTPAGTVTLTFQIFFPVGSPKTNIETVFFSDGPVSDADLRQMAIEQAAKDAAAKQPKSSQRALRSEAIAAA